MKKQLLLWSTFIFLAGSVYAGAVALDKFKWQSQDMDKQEAKSDPEQEEDKCIKELLKDVTPISEMIDCKGYTYIVPKHWWLNTDQICNGNLNLAMAVPGLQNWDYRKALWKLVLCQLGYAYIGIDSTEFGGAIDDLVSQFQGAISIIGVAGQSIKPISESVKLLASANSNNVIIIIDRESVGELSRELFYTSKYTTYGNAIERLSKELKNIADAGELVENVGDGIGVITSAKEITIKIPREKANSILGGIYFIEFLRLISKHISNNSSLDPALIEVAQETLNTSDKKVKEVLNNELRKRESSSLTQLDIGLVSLLTQFIAPTVAPLAGAIYLTKETIDVLLGKAYITPIYLATLAYTLADANMQNDSLSRLIKTMSILLGDKNMHGYYEGTIFTTYFNIVPLSWSSNKYGSMWHDVVFDDNRNASMV